MRRRKDAQEAAEELFDAVEQRRRGEARTLAAICDLAVEYRLDEEELLFTMEKALQEKLTRPGAEGTPSVSEFLAVELAALLHCSDATATAKIASALNLRYRHPRLWEAVQSLTLESWIAEKAASCCRSLSPILADEVSADWLEHQQGLAPGPSLNLLKKLVIEADVEAAAEREQAAQEYRSFGFRGVDQGLASASGCFDPIEAGFIDARVTEIARMIAPLYPELSFGARRTKAIYLAMNPHRLIAIQNQLANQPELEWLDPVIDPADACPTCGDPRHTVVPEGAVEVSPGESAWQPHVELVVHLHPDQLGSLDGAARIETSGWLTTRMLGQLLGDGVGRGEFDLKVQPVIDLPGLPANDGYQPTARMRKAMKLAQPQELFPFSNRTELLDIDHVVSFLPGLPGQTALEKMARLSRRVHRVKTRGDWILTMVGPGHVQWVSPLGYVYEITQVGCGFVCTPARGRPSEPGPAEQAEAA